MQRRLTRLFGELIATITILLGLFVFTTATALRQQSSAPTPPSRTPNPVGPTDPRWQRPPPNETDVRSRSMTKAVESAKEDTRVPLTVEIIRDFERLHAIREEKLVRFAASDAPDLKQLAHAASEASDRANHIKLTMPIPLSKGEQKKKAQAQANKEEEFAPALAGLNAAIKRFLDNPVFRVARPDDTELRAAAAQDLEEIIRLGARVNKLAKKMAKATGSI